MNSDGIGIGPGMSTPGQLPPPDYEQSRKSSSGDDPTTKCVVPAVQYAGNVTTVTGPSWGPMQPAQSYPQQFPGYSNVAYYPPPVYGGNRDSMSGAGHVIVFQQAAPAPVGKSYACHTAAACLLFWFCGCVFGGIAFVLAVFAKSASAAGRADEARKYGLSSMVVSIVGLVVGLIAWGFAIWAIVVFVTHVDDYYNPGDPCTNYWCNNRCYAYSNYITQTQCTNYYSDSCYSYGVCYYNY